MSKVCPNVATEPTLQPVINERFFHCSTNTDSGAHIDVRAQGFGAFTINNLFLTFVCLTPWLHLIIKPPSLFALDPMIMRNVEHMNNGSVRWKEDLLLPLYFQHLVV